MKLISVVFIIKAVNSYNMCKNKRYLPTPTWMKRKRRSTIEADSCCAKVLLHLWAYKIDTLYHCCRHLSKRRPRLILAAGCTEKISYIRKLIRQVDSRSWSIS